MFIFRPILFSRTYLRIIVVERAHLNLNILLAKIAEFLMLYTTADFLGFFVALYYCKFSRNF